MTKPDNQPHLTAEQRIAILQRQFDRAMTGNEALLIHLGQVELGQVVVTKQVIEEDPSLGLTWDQIMDEVNSRIVNGECTVITANTEEGFVPLCNVTDDVGIKMITDESAAAVDPGESSMGAVAETVSGFGTPPDGMAVIRDREVPQCTPASMNNYKSPLAEAINTGQAIPMDVIPSPAKKHRGRKKSVSP